MSRPNVHVRRALPSDSELIRSWRADPRLGAFQEKSGRPGEIIEVDGIPVGWIDPHPAYAPAWQGHLGPSVGSEPWTPDLFVIPDAWGRGIARSAIRSVAERCVASGATCMVVDVERDNVASQRAFRGAGWEVVPTDEEAVILRYAATQRRRWSEP